MQGICCHKLSDIPLAPMGDLAPRSEHACPAAQPPIDTSGNFPVHMSGRGGKNKLKHFLINFLAISGNSKHFSCFPKKKGGGRKKNAKNSLKWREN